MKAYELLDSPEKLHKGNLAAGKDGYPTWSGDPMACKWCMAGAVLKCYPVCSDYKKVWDVLCCRIGNPIKWNDAPERTWKEVHDLLKELDI